MNFLLPSLLFGFLALAAMPLLIHLVNRMRYKSMPWAAMHFLTKAKKSSTQLARLKEFLILALRVLALLAFAFALGRPLVGGWLTWAASREPDTVIILLDRSASMQSIDVGHQLSRLKRSKKILLDVANKSAKKADFVLLDNATGREFLLDELQLLEDEELFGATDTKDNMGQLFRQALEYVGNHECGKVEFWVLSDMMSWRTEESHWEQIKHQLNTSKQSIQVRVLKATGQDLNSNNSISISKTQIVDNRLQISLQIRAPQLLGEVLPLQFKIAGSDEVRTIEINSEVVNRIEYFDLTDVTNPVLMGSVSFPADSNLSDNEAYFAVPRDGQSRTLVVAKEKKEADPHRWLANPLGESQSDWVTYLDLGNTDLSTYQLIILCDGFVESKRLQNKMASYLEAGGLVVAYPDEVLNKDEFMGLSWKESSLLVSSSSNPIKNWQADYGPLARSSSGIHLSLDKLKLQRVAEIQDQGESEQLITLMNESAGLKRKDVGLGSLFIWNTRMDKSWSSLHEATVLLPFYSRLQERGLRQLMKIRYSKPKGLKELRESEMVLSPFEYDQAGLRRGIYKANDTTWVLNTATEESRDRGPDDMQIQEFEERYGFSVFNSTETLRNDDDVHLELWKGFLYFMLVCLIFEALLTLRQPQIQKSEGLR